MLLHISYCYRSAPPALSPVRAEVMRPPRKAREAVSAATAAPPAAAPTLKTLDASQSSIRQLKELTARPRIDFSSILGTVIPRP